MNQKVADYIDKSRKAGKSDGEIREELKGIGLSDVEVSEALSGPMFAASSEPQPLKKDVKLSGDALLDKQIASGANWFFLVAGLSIFNSLMIFGKADIYFPIGLGATLLIDLVGSAFGSTGMILAFFLDLLIASFYAVFGVLTKRRNVLLFGVGMVFYAFDAVIYLIALDPVGVILHLVGL